MCDIFGILRSGQENSISISKIKYIWPLKYISKVEKKPLTEGASNHRKVGQTIIY